MNRELILGDTLLEDRVVDQSLGELGPFGPGQHPAHDVAAVDIQNDVEVVVRPLLRSVQFRYVPRPNFVRPLGDELGFLMRRMGCLAAAFAHLVVFVEDPVHGGERCEVGPLVEQLGVDGGRCLVDELIGLEGRLDLLTLDFAQGPGLGGAYPFGAHRLRALAVLAIPGGPIRSHDRQRVGRAHNRGELANRFFDHVLSPFSAVLSVASCSNSAESFFWISTTCLDLSSSWASRTLSFFNREISRSRGSAFWRPEGRARAASAPWSRWRRQVVMSEEYKPSRRSIAPRADRGRVSYSARTLALYFAENCRRPKERSGTSGSGGAVSSIAPAWWRVRSRWLIVVVMGEVPSPPFSSLICQGKPSHSRLTQRAMGNGQWAMGNGQATKPTPDG